MQLMFIAILLALTIPATAQDGPPPANASELALQIDNAVNSMAQTIMQQAREIERLKKELATKQVPPLEGPSHAK
jgi:hypothetical protein